MDVRVGHISESWVPKNWCFWTVVLEKTLESPLDCKEIQSIHSKGNQSWVFIGRTDVEAETPILWLPDVKSWLIGKDSDAGRDWGQEEKGTTEEEMIGWNHWLNGYEFGWTLGVGDGQGNLVCCGSWSHKESDTTKRLNWTNSTHSSILAWRIPWTIPEVHGVPKCWTLLHDFQFSLIPQGRRHSSWGSSLLCSLFAWQRNKATLSLSSKTFSIFLFSIGAQRANILATNWIKLEHGKSDFIGVRNRTSDQWGSKIDERRERWWEQINTLKKVHYKGVEK